MYTSNHQQSNTKLLLLIFTIIEIFCLKLNNINYNSWNSEYELITYTLLRVG